MKLIPLSHNHYAISDKAAGKLAREQATAKRLPRMGYCVDITLPDGRHATLSRTTLLSGEIPTHKRRWVWTVMPND